MKWSLFAAGALAGVSSHALAAGAPTVTEVAPVEVIAMTPLSSGDASRIAAPVQTITAGQLARSNALDLTAYMNRELAGVYVNDVQNNPLQPDINYRGYPDIYKRLTDDWMAWNKAMLPETPDNSTYNNTGDQWADHIGTPAIDRRAVDEGAPWPA